jgi:photosystem II stability/assembly factor-like uncharacterized protein
VGDSGCILRSTDGGHIWGNILTGITEGLSTVSFFDSTHGIIIGSNGAVLQTADAGLTWTKRSIGPGYNLSSAAVTPNGSGIAVGGNCFRSSDYGSTWAEVTSAVTHQSLNDIAYADAQHGIAVGNHGTVLITKDGGEHWVPQFQGTLLAYSGIRFNGVAYPDTNTITIVGDAGTIIHSSDAGVHWVAQNSGTTEPIFTVHFINADTGFSTTYNKILKTIDGGAHWKSMISGGMNFSISFGDPRTGIIVGIGFILRTTDGGESWNEVLPAPGRMLFDVELHHDTGYAVGDIGTILKTTDRGITWLRQNSGTRSDLNGVVTSSGLIVTAIGTNGTILRTTDGGETWVRQPSGTDLSLLAGAFANDQVGTVVGAGGVILRTTTGGGVQGKGPLSVTNKSLPEKYSLGQNYPNPFNPRTNIKFAIPEKGGLQLTTLKIYNLLGQEVATLVNDIKPPGTYTVSWNAAGNPSGVYFYRLTTQGYTNVKKLIILK